VPTSTRPEIRALVCHHRAFLDPAPHADTLRHAPDVFFARVRGLSTAQRSHLTAWLEREGTAAPR
jgi:hypothetical protein